MYIYIYSYIYIYTKILMRQVCVGLEYRLDAEDEMYTKQSYSDEKIKEALGIFRTK